MQIDDADFDANLSVLQLIKLERESEADDENELVLSSFTPAKPIQHQRLDSISE